MSRRVSSILAAFALLVVGNTFVTGFAPVRTPTRPAPTVVYLVRHAEKTGEERDADLSAEGRTRADVLAWMLRDVHLDAVFSTEYRRTLDTVRPTATRKGLTVTPYAAKGGQLIPKIQNEFGGKTVLVCGHSNTIPKLLDNLGVGIEEDVLGGYDDLFMVVFDVRAGGTIDVITHERLHYPGRR